MHLWNDKDHGRVNSWSSKGGGSTGVLTRNYCTLLVLTGLGLMNWCFVVQLKKVCGSSSIKVVNVKHRHVICT